MSKKTKKTYSEDKKNKKRKALFIFLPFFLFGTAGATVGGLYAAGLFTRTKLNVETIASKLQNYVSASKVLKGQTSVDTGFQGKAFYVDQQFVNAPTIDEVISLLLSDANFETELQDNEKQFINNIEITEDTPVAGENDFYEWTVSAIKHSRGFEGSFKFLFYTSQSELKDLAPDITKADINFSDDVINKYQSVTGIELSEKLSADNTALNTRQTKLMYESTKEDGTSEWVDWKWDDSTNPWGTNNTTNKFGVKANAEDASTNQDESLKLWDKTADSYAHLRIVPIENSNYYNAYDPANANTYKDISVKLYRPEISDGSTWLADKAVWSTGNNNKFYITPDNISVESRIVELFNDREWFVNKLDDQTANNGYDWSDTWGMELEDGSSTDTSMRQWILELSGNPFFNTQMSNKADAASAGYEFITDTREKVDLSTTTLKDLNISGMLYTDLSVDPFAMDNFKLVAKQVMGDEYSKFIWSDITITFEAGKIIFTGTQSGIYSTTPLTITYTLIQ